MLVFLYPISTDTVS